MRLPVAQTLAPTKLSAMSCPTPNTQHPPDDQVEMGRDRYEIDLDRYGIRRDQYEIGRDQYAVDAVRSCIGRVQCHLERDAKSRNGADPIPHA